MAMANLRKIQWEDAFGSFKLICIFIAITFEYTHAASCPLGWISRGRSCYFLSSSANSWHGARTFCQRFNGDLVIINDAAENQFLRSLTSRRFYIGLSDIKEEGTWQWVDGSNLTLSSSHWDRGEPNNLGNEDCGEMLGGVLFWNDLPCGWHFHYVCEIDKGNDVLCSDNFMSFNLSSYGYNLSNYNSITLLNSTCQARVSSTVITIGTKLNSCGTTKVENQTHISYTNQVIFRPKAASSGLITRGNEHTISFTCSYAKDGHTKGASFVPVRRVSANESGVGSFTFELGMYKSNAYINPVSSYPINLRLNDEAYFQVTASVDDNDLVMLVDKCYSTPSLNRNALPQHSLIRNGCATDDTVRFYLTDEKRMRFSVKAFRYVNSFSTIYIHCFVFLCQKTSSDPRCTSGCNGNNVNRVKRDLSNGKSTDERTSYTKYYMLEAGPLQKIGSDTLTDKQEGRNTRHNHQPTTIGLSSSVAALAILVLILILKKKLKKRMKNKTPVEMGVDNPPSKGNTYVISGEANGN